MLFFLQQIPPLILAACALLVVLFFVFLTRMLTEAGRVLRDIGEFIDILRQLLPTGITNRREGLRLSEIELLRASIETRRSLLSPNTARLWTDIQNSLQPYTEVGGTQRWFSVRPLGEVLPESAVIDRVYHASFHQSVPSLLTALGLMATFVAILAALEGVTVQVRGGAEIVSGIGTLINGLAGKFLSSILALFLAVNFTVIEKKWCERRLQNAYDALLRQAEEVIPTLSPTRILLDMHALSSQRTALLANFYKEVVDRFISLAKTEIVPGLAGNFAMEITDQVGERLGPVLDEVRDRANELERISQRMTANEAAAISTDTGEVGMEEAE